MFENKDSLTRREKRIRKLASEWLVEREEGWQPGREREFNLWKAKDFRHEIALRELEISWDRLKQLRHLIDDPTLRPNLDILSTGNRIERRRRKKLFAGAGSLAAVIALSIGLWTMVDEKEPATKELSSPDFYSTTVNDYKQIVLEDGSIMEMNASTRVSISYLESRRQVHLLSGEAHFQVEKNPLRPFLVDAGSVSVKAVGTAFNVRYDSDEVQVLVTEGRVSVNALPGKAGDILPEAEVSWMFPELVAGDQATISIQGNHLIPLRSKVETEEFEEILAWKGPRLFFNGTPLEEAVRQFNEHNEIKVIIEGDALRKLSIGGSFLVEDVEAFVRLLAGDGSIVVERTGYDTVTLKSAN